MSKKIAITLGEPAGIGAELILDLAKNNQLDGCIIIGDKNLLIGLPPSIECIHIPTIEKVELGKLNVNNSRYVLDLLDTAANGCMSGRFSAMVTCPLHKGIINDSVLLKYAKFTGHTEYLAELSNTDNVVMMLLNKHMRVALATTHLPLKDVANEITKDSLTTTLNILIKDMQTKFAISHPKIAVCGLNPHAGEDGYLGMEEIETINPVIKQ